MLAMFKTPTALQLAKQELEDARRAQLQAHSNVESAQATLAYQNARVARLEAYVNTHKEAQRPSCPPFPPRPSGDLASFPSVYSLGANHA